MKKISYQAIMWIAILSLAIIATNLPDYTLLWNL